jgi:cobalt-zinc-cadmium efflux system protein
VLLEESPPATAVAEVTDPMRRVPGVAALHDLHVWTIASGFVALSGHVQTSGRAGAEVLHELRRTLREHFGIAHVTLQVEECLHPEAPCCVGDTRCLSGNL